MGYHQSIIIFGKVKNSKFTYGTFNSGKEYIHFNFKLIIGDIEILCKKTFFNVNQHSVEDSNRYVKHMYHECKRIENLKLPYVKIRTVGDFNGFSKFNNTLFLNIDFIDIVEETKEDKNEITVKMLVQDKSENKLTLASSADDAYPVRLDIELDEGIENRALVGQGYAFQCKLFNIQTANNNNKGFSWDEEYAESGVSLKATPIGVIGNYKTDKFTDIKIVIKEDKKEMNKILNESEMDF